MAMFESHMLKGASNVRITNSSLNIGPSQKQLAYEKLSAAAAHSALHDGPARTDDTRCHKDTRVNIFDKLERWAQGILEEEASLFWLYGGAGAGKSAIMQTLAERCAAQKLALGSFFFSRSDPTRNTATALIPTLAYQVAQLFPDALQVLHPFINRDTLIFKKSPQVQLMDLLVQPLQHLVQLGAISNAPKSPRVFLIDGLDECENPDHQKEIILAVATVCHKYLIPVKFLIASRPELAISTYFRMYTQADFSLGSISLSEDPSAELDIRRYIEDEFVRICLHHPFSKGIPPEWPSKDDIDTLVQKSSSHFVYASTTVKHIWSAKENPVRSLQVVLGLSISRTESPFAELDAIYHHIFQSAGHLDKVLQILAHCLFSDLDQTASVICIMYEYSLDDFDIFIADMTPLIIISSSEGCGVSDKRVNLLHASLGDFLCDPVRSGSLCLDKRLYLAYNLQRCAQLLDLYSQNQTTEPKWPVNSWDKRESYCKLWFEILRVIREFGNLDAVQAALSRISLSQLFECIKRLTRTEPDQAVRESVEWISMILLEICQVETPASLSKRYMDEFLDILESVISTCDTPLVSIILPLTFLGYPTHELTEMLSYSVSGTPIDALLKDRGPVVAPLFERVVKCIAISEASICHRRADLSPERLAAAVETISDFLTNRWANSPKRGLRSCLLCTTPKTFAGLLNTLVWLLPKAGSSKKIIIFSKSTLQQNSCISDPCNQVRKCLDQYSIRVQNEKLEKPTQGIRNGSPDAPPSFRELRSRPLFDSAPPWPGSATRMRGQERESKPPAPSLSTDGLANNRNSPQEGDIKMRTRGLGMQERIAAHSEVGLVIGPSSSHMSNRSFARSGSGNARYSQDHQEISERPTPTARTSIPETFGYLTHESECEREEVRAMRERHAIEMKALRSQLEDAQRINNTLKEENGRLRDGLDRVIEAMREIESLKQACAKPEMEQPRLPYSTTRD